MDQWIGRTQEAYDVVGLAPARHLAAMLDLPTASIAFGSEIPGFWYQILFSPFDLQSKLAADGHPTKGEFLPPIPWPRRLLAGRRVGFDSPIQIGAEVYRTSTIQSIVPKTGRSGSLCFVTVAHELKDSNNRRLVKEEQDIVYRQAVDTPSDSTTPSSSASHPERIESFPPPHFSDKYRPDATMLFRYSAITFNAHRIHYDLPFARDVEGYPELVVNGGLTTIKLWQMVAAHTNRPILASRSRNLQTLFANREATLCAAFTGTSQILAWALNDQGVPVMRMELELGELA
ncbi:FAS1-like dehydratase domain-containing protein [Ottowia thiooxydans]|uniref:3-methylfumaryl-CoA hydratase n=1 Tax=Ottowia thiooxydans TaxID=219182 RepID=A0ABV2QCB7_9BURK